MLAGARQSPSTPTPTLLVLSYSLLHFLRVSHDGRYVLRALAHRSQTNRQPKIWQFSKVRRLFEVQYQALVNQLLINIDRGLFCRRALVPAGRKCANLFRVGFHLSCQITWPMGHKYVLIPKQPPGLSPVQREKCLISRLSRSRYTQWREPSDTGFTNWADWALFPLAFLTTLSFRSPGAWTF